MINRTVPGLLFAGVIAFSLAACGGPTPQVPAGPPAATTQPTSPLRFPNTEVTAQLVGFDGAAGMVRFQVVHWVAGGANNGHYEPSDAGTHRLPLSPRPTVLSALTLCSTEMTVDDQGNPTRPCSRQQLVAALTRGTPVLAKLHVDGTDHIDRVAEVYHP